MDPEKVDLGPNVTSHSIEIDVEDLSPGESLTSRYERYSKEDSDQISGAQEVTPAPPPKPQDATSNHRP